MAGEYNRNEWLAFAAIERVCDRLDESEIRALRESTRAYLDFRAEVDAFNRQHFQGLCRRLCFENGRSACCGFESIIMFFADQAIAWLLAGHETRQALRRVLERPNRSGRCVYLGAEGCLWPLPPVTCGLFFCDEAKEQVFALQPEAQEMLVALRRREKGFTWPDRPVLFDDLERFFIERGADVPTMLFHRSPGLLRIKQKAGLAGKETGRR